MAASKALATTSVASGGIGRRQLQLAATAAAGPAELPVPGRGTRSSGCPRSSQARVTAARRSASARIAPSPTSCEAAGNAQALPRVIDPKPRASRPSPVRSRQCTFSRVVSVHLAPAEHVGGPVAELLEVVLDLDDAHVGRRATRGRRARAAGGRPPAAAPRPAPGAAAGGTEEWGDRRRACEAKYIQNQGNPPRYARSRSRRESLFVKAEQHCNEHAG